MSAVICVIVLIATLVECKVDSDDAKYSPKGNNTNNNHNNNNNNGNGMQMKETRKHSSKAGGDTQITVMSSEYNGKGFKDGLEIMKESEMNSSGRKCPSEQSKLSKCGLYKKDFNRVLIFPRHPFESPSVLQFGF